MQPLSLSVQIPFRGSLPLNAPPDTTISSLYAMVARILQSPPPSTQNSSPSSSSTPPTTNTPQPPLTSLEGQCIVYRGHILPDATTLQAAGVVNGAVLHLMRRPSPNRQSVSAPNSDDEETFTFSMVYGRLGPDDIQPGLQALPERMAQDDPSNGMFMSIVSGSVVDGHDAPAGGPASRRRRERAGRRGRRPGVYPSYVRVGRNPMAIFDGPDLPDPEHVYPFRVYNSDHDHDHDHHRDHDHHHDHDHDHDHHHDHHHHDHDHDHHHDHHHHDHPHMHAHYYVFGSDAPRPSIQPQDANQLNIFFVRRRADSQIRYADAYDVVAYVLGAIGYGENAQNHAAQLAATTAVASQSAEHRGTVSFTALENAWLEARRAQRLITPRDDVAEEQQNTIPDNMPLAPDGAGEPQVAAGRAGVRTLMPSLAQMLRLVADQIDGTDQEQMFEDGTRDQTNDLLQQLGTLGATLSSTTALLAGLVPPARTETSISETTLETDAQQSEERSALPDGERAQQDDTSGDTGAPGMTTAQLDRPHPVRNGSDSSQQPASSSSERSVERTQVEGYLPALMRRMGGGPVPTESDDESHPDPSQLSPRTPDAQRANAEFSIRVMAYYMRSFANGGAGNETSLTTESGVTAQSVVNITYGDPERPHPIEPLLLVLQRVMYALTPRQFHDVLCGDCSPLDSLSIDLWDLAKEQLYSAGSRNAPEGTSEEDFVAEVCDRLHTFVHLIQSVWSRPRGPRFEITGPASQLCSESMHIIQHHVHSLAELLQSQRRHPNFGEALLNLLKLTIAILSAIFCACLDIPVDVLIDMIGKAVFEVGYQVLGPEFSVIFPVLAALLSSRIRHVHDQYQQDPESYIRLCNSHTSDERGTEGSESQQEMPTRTRQSSNSGDSVRNDEGLPDLVDEDTSEDVEEDDSWCEDLYDEMESTGTYEEDDYHSGEDEDDNSDHVNMEEYVNDRNISIYATRGRDVESNTVEEDIDDDDLDELAAELEREYDSIDEKEDTMTHDLDNIAEELLREEQGATSGPAPRENAQVERPTRVTAAGSGTKRMAGMPSAFSSPMLRTGLAAGLSSHMPNSAAFSRASFSTTASAPRASRAAVSAVTRDEFSQLLGTDRGATWRRVVREDEAKMRASAHGPLSRGYQHDRSTVSELNVASAVALGLDDVRVACREAQLSDDSLHDVEDAMQENGSLYLRELEQALRARLATDPDFDPEQFPAAAARFGRLG